MPRTSLDALGAALVPYTRVEDRRGRLTALPMLQPSLQVNVVDNPYYATLRGLHYQVGAAAQAKRVTVLKGAIVDVVVDLRPDRATFLDWASVMLADETPVTLDVPRWLAHGYFVVKEQTQVLYTVSARWAPDAERGLRWDDPVLGIRWPDRPRILSERDQQWPLLGRATAHVIATEGAP